MKPVSVSKAVLAVAALTVATLPQSLTNAFTYRTPAAANVADGAALFTARCVICHGKDGTGLANWRSKGQPDLTNPDWQKSRTDSQIADTIKNGKGKFMPAFKSKLSDEEVTAVVAHVRQLAKKK